MKDLIFKIRFKLMPKEFKEGSWFVVNGNFLNIGEMWVKSKKKGWWHIPRIDYDSNST